MFFGIHLWSFGMIEDVLSGLCDWLSEGIIGFADFIYSRCFALEIDFDPNLIPGIDQMANIFMTIGVMMFIIFLYTEATKTLIAPSIGNEVQNPIYLVVRAAIFGIMIALSPAIIKFIQDTLIGIIDSMNIVSGSEGASYMSVKMIAENKINIEGMLAGDKSLVASFTNLVFSVMFLVNLFRAGLNQIERIVTFNIYCKMFPIALSMVMSRETSRIAKQYFINLITMSIVLTINCGLLLITWNSLATMPGNESTEETQSVEQATVITAEGTYASTNALVIYEDEAKAEDTEEESSEGNMSATVFQHWMVIFALLSLVANSEKLVNMIGLQAMPSGAMARDFGMALRTAVRGGKDMLNLGRGALRTAGRVGSATEGLARFTSSRIQNSGKMKAAAAQHGLTDPSKKSATQMAEEMGASMYTAKQDKDGKWSLSNVSGEQKRAAADAIKKEAGITGGRNKVVPGLTGSPIIDRDIQKGFKNAEKNAKAAVERLNNGNATANDMLMLAGAGGLTKSLSQNGTATATKTQVGNATATQAPVQMNRNGRTSTGTMTMMDKASFDSLSSDQKRSAERQFGARIDLGEDSNQVAFLKPSGPSSSAPGVFNAPESAYTKLGGTFGGIYSGSTVDLNDSTVASGISRDTVGQGVLLSNDNGKGLFSRSQDDDGNVSTYLTVDGSMQSGQINEFANNNGYVILDDSQYTIEAGGNKTFKVKASSDKEKADVRHEIEDQMNKKHEPTQYTNEEL